jgi:hypothetical protein
MSKKLSYIPGDHWVVCQRSGKVIRSSEAKREWTGLIVAPEYWEPRHPQDFVRVRVENTAAKGLVNPEPADTFVAPVCTTRTSVAGGAVAGCSIAGLDIEVYTIPSGTFSGSPL